MKQNEYYKKVLEDLKEELDRETKYIDGLRKILNKSQREGWKSLTPLREVIAEWETKRDSVAKAIEKIEEVTRTKK